MGNTNSQEAQESQTVVNYTHGHHVIKITPGSPGDKGGLIPFFDYLVEANGVVLDKDSVLVEVLTEAMGKELKFIVYNAKKEDIREVVIRASDWGEQTRLGVSVRFAELKPNMMDFVWHVLEVSSNSPASDAGLIADHDYIVGTTTSAFTDSDDFYNLIDKNHRKPIELYVYNVAADQVRIVILTPNPSWGGSGSLGCDVGYGLIHRIPSEESRRKLLGVSPDTPLKRNLRLSNSPPPSPSPQPISQIPFQSPVQSPNHYPIPPIVQSIPSPAYHPPTPSIPSPSPPPFGQTSFQSPVQTPIAPLPLTPYPSVPSVTPSSVPSSFLTSIPSPVPSPVQSPPSQSPVQSPPSLSPIQSPVQSPPSQSPVQSPAPSPLLPANHSSPSPPSTPLVAPISVLPSSSISSPSPIPSPTPSPVPSPTPSPLSPIQSPVQPPAPFSPSPLSPSLPPFPLSPLPTTPFPSTPTSLTGNSPSLETLQALKDKQVKLKEQLKSLQSQS